jgi:hypothetical protein
MPGSTAEINDARGNPALERQSIQQSRAHFSFQDRMLIITPCLTIKSCANAILVWQVQIQFRHNLFLRLFTYTVPVLLLTAD